MLITKHLLLRIAATTVIAAGLLFPPFAYPQSALENAIQGFGKQNAVGYLQPMADLFGADLNTGYFRSAQISTFGFHLSLDFVGMAAPVSDEQKAYTATAPPGFNPASFQTATIFGGLGTSVAHSTNPGLRYRGSDGIFNTKMFPFAVPQLTVGSVLGTDAIIRYVPLPKIGDNKIPSTTTWSLGARHSISQYIPLVPIDIAVGFLYSKFKCGDILDAKGITYGVQASKTLSVLTLHGGFNIESSTLKVAYVSTNPLVPDNIEFDLTGKRKASFTAGLDLSLGGIHLFGNANLGSITNFTAGFGFGN